MQLPASNSEADLAVVLRAADLLLMCYMSITALVIGQAPRLRGIVKYGLGIDAIDIEAAIEKGIPTVNVPLYGEQTIAEGAFTLALALLKRLQPLHAAVQMSAWVEPQPQWLANDMAGSTVALIGMGRIGRPFARMAGAGFGAKVIAYNPAVSVDEMDAPGVKKVNDLHALLMQADVVSLHCVLNEPTNAMVGSQEFAAMQRQPVFINVSRGALVDEQALVKALDSGQIRAAGLDVYATEPLNKVSHPLATLFGRDNVILMPHIAFYTVEAMQRLSLDTLQRSAEILAGLPVTIRSSDPRLLAQKEVCKVRIVCDDNN